MGKKDDLVRRINNEPGLTGTEAVAQCRADGGTPDFSAEHFDSVSFRGADLRDVSFRGATMNNCDFTEATISGADFGEARLLDVVGLSTASGLLRANFVGATLSIRNQKMLLALLKASFLRWN